MVRYKPVVVSTPIGDKGIIVTPHTMSFSDRDTSLVIRQFNKALRAIAVQTVPQGQGVLS